jgi:hypothetical protein
MGDTCLKPRPKSTGPSNSFLTVAKRLYRIAIDKIRVHFSVFGTAAKGANAIEIQGTELAMPHDCCRCEEFARNPGLRVFRDLLKRPP